MSEEASVGFIPRESLKRTMKSLLPDGEREGGAVSPLGLIDSHAHLFFEDYKDEVAAVLQRAREAGVGRLINVGTGVAESRQAIALAEQHDWIYASVGVHPHDVAKMSDADLDTLKDLTGNRRVVAIGEVGLDYHYEHSPQDVQQERFRNFIRLSLETKLPLIIHCREAFEDCFKILDEENGWNAGGVFHCFTGDAATAERIVKQGFYVSFSGIVTFKKSQELQEAARAVPDDRFLIETDCPFLAPEPFRGKRNEPAYVVKVAEKLAALRGSELTEIARLSTANTRRFFKLKLY